MNNDAIEAAYPTDLPSPLEPDTRILRHLNRVWPDPQIISPSILGLPGDGRFLESLQRLIDDGLVMAEAVAAPSGGEPYATDVLITPRGSRMAAGLPLRLHF